jgi:hypothetical protein
MLLARRAPARVVTLHAALLFPLFVIVFIMVSLVNPTTGSPCAYGPVMFCYGFDTTDAPY